MPFPVILESHQCTSVWHSIRDILCGSIDGLEDVEFRELRVLVQWADVGDLKSPGAPARYWLGFVNPTTRIARDTKGGEVSFFAELTSDGGQKSVQTFSQPLVRPFPDEENAVLDQDAVGQAEDGQFVYLKAVIFIDRADWCEEMSPGKASLGKPFKALYFSHNANGENVGTLRLSEEAADASLSATCSRDVSPITDAPAPPALGSDSTAEFLLQLCNDRAEVTSKLAEQVDEFKSVVKQLQRENDLLRTANEALHGQVAQIQGDLVVLYKQLKGLAPQHQSSYRSTSPQAAGSAPAANYYDVTTWPNDVVGAGHMVTLMIDGVIQQGHNGKRDHLKKRLLEIKAIVIDMWQDRIKLVRQCGGQPPHEALDNANRKIEVAMTYLNTLIGHAKTVMGADQPTADVCAMTVVKLRQALQCEDDVEKNSDQALMASIIDAASQNATLEAKAARTQANQGDKKKKSGNGGGKE